ncbi:hypothetical protein NXF25_009877 [Crotalus adamanteus]|uniref:WAP domain-containing protein n=1 Tax=Crotalus adamanteus TaxID=8729 RepID=A0AAW1BS71_CROAD
MVKANGVKLLLGRISRASSPGVGQTAIMSSGGLLLLLRLLTLWAELTPVSGQDRPKKRGVCPQGSQQQGQQGKIPCCENCENNWKCPGQKKCCRYGGMTECKDAIFEKCGGSCTLSLVQFAQCKGMAVGRLLGPDVLWAPAGFSGVSQALLLSIKGGTDVRKGRCPDVEAELGVVRWVPSSS